MILLIVNLTNSNFDQSRRDSRVSDSPYLISTLPEHLNQVDLEEERENQELSAMQELSEEAAGARTIPLLLEKLSAPGQGPFYYCGGFTILSKAITNCESSFVCHCPWISLTPPTAFQKKKKDNLSFSKRIPHNPAGYIYSAYYSFPLGCKDLSASLSLFGDANNKHFSFCSVKERENVLPSIIDILWASFTCHNKQFPI